MSVQALGYIGLRAKELGDWAKFGSDFLGMQRIDKTRQTMAFRMDDRKQRFIIDADGGQGIGFFGWEVADASAMEALAAKLEAAGVKRRARLARARGRAAREGPDRVSGSGRHAYRGVSWAGGRRDGIRSRPQHLGVPHRPARHGARRAALRGHRAMTAFYEGLLGFRLSDYFLRPYPARFFHCNPRHHSLALIATGKNAPHHLMMELFSPRRCRAGLRHRAEVTRDRSR